MNELKFNSQICTSKEQSRRLLEMGLKPETADMAYKYDGTYPYDCYLGILEDDDYISSNIIIDDIIPAWSLHRLIEIRFAGDNIGFGVYNIHNRNFGNSYEILISVIKYLIDIGEFNKEYLNT